MSSRSVDRISGLPDELLIHILSFVTTRQAVRMSLLSKRWSHLWTSIPSLHFSDSEFLGYVGGDNVSPRFLRFVDEVLNRRQENNNITKFHFSTYHYIRVNVLREWIHHAVRGRKVEELTIKSEAKEEKSQRIKLPRGLFACRSLRVLKLLMGNVDVGICKLELPTTLCDLRLKSLYIRALVFNELRRLISCCPFLQVLYLSNVQCDDLKISSHSLEKLIIRRSTVPTIEVSAPNLLSIKIDCWEVEDCVLKNLVSLVEGEIEISFRFPKYNYVFGRILEEISNVSSLTLTYSDIGRQDLPDDLPMFENLTYLNLNIWLNKHNIEVMIYILKHSPNLKTLVIYNDGLEDFYKKEEQEECYCWIENQQSDRFLLHLRKIKIQNFQSSARHLDQSSTLQFEIQQELVKYLLRSSPSVEEIMITYGNHDMANF